MPTFGVLLAAGLLAGLALSERTARLTGIEPERMWNAGLFAVVAAFFFSRLLLVITNWHTFLRFPLLVLALPSLTATGLLLTTAATLLWLRLKRVPLRQALEAWVPCGLMVWGFLALGHFAEGSDPGMPTSAFWGVHLRGSSFAQQPVALIASMVAFSLAALTYWQLKQRLPGTGLGLLGAGIGQVLISFLRQPGEASFAGLDSIEWVGLALALTGGLLLLQDWRVEQKRVKPSALSGLHKQVR